MLKNVVLYLKLFKYTDRPLQSMIVVFLFLTAAFLLIPVISKGTLGFFILLEFITLIWLTLPILLEQLFYAKMVSASPVRNKIMIFYDMVMAVMAVLAFLLCVLFLYERKEGITLLTVLAVIFGLEQMGSSFLVKMSYGVFFLVSVIHGLVAGLVYGILTMVMENTWAVSKGYIISFGMLMILAGFLLGQVFRKCVLKREVSSWVMGSLERKMQ